jgi:transposase InsO family protein
VIDIIDHFTRYLWSYPVKNNNAQNALYCIKNFCMMLGYPKILQSDNGSEYKNKIFSAPRHPETSGVIEVSHKEIRKNVIINYNHNPDNFDVNNAVLDAIENHN